MSGGAATIDLFSPPLFSLSHALVYVQSSLCPPVFICFGFGLYSFDFYFY
jgi:hypothetical protein